MSAEIREGDVFDVLPTVRPGSIDVVCTSPPYWMLRSYLPKGHPLKPREIGSEPTPAAYVANMVRVFRLVRDTMADHATCWLNVGDSYSTGGSGSRLNLGTLQGRPNAATTAQGYGRKDNAGIDAGNLCLIPQRLAIALQDDGWLVRSVVVWHKPAAMPASLSGWQWRRCRVKVRSLRKETLKGAACGHRDGPGCGIGLAGTPSTEWTDCPGCSKCEPHGGYVLRRGSWRPTSSWEPVLLLAKTKRYFCDGEAVKQPAASATISRNEYTRIIDDPDEQFAVAHDHETLTTTANLRDVWTIPAEPLREKHYASFPTELVHRCLKAGTSAKGYCPKCGAPWVRVVESERLPSEGRQHESPRGDKKAANDHVNLTGGFVMTSETTGWRASCPDADLDPRPGRVLDPFAGSGRTGIECLRLGLDFIGCELNPEYAEMARRLLRDESPLFAVTE